MNRADTMQAAVQRYLDERHRLGFALKSPGTELMRFARFADARDHQGPLTLDVQLDWAREHVARTTTVTAARRLEVVRPFATYYRQLSPPLRCRRHSSWATAIDDWPPTSTPTRRLAICWPCLSA